MPVDDQAYSHARAHTQAQANMLAPPERNVSGTMVEVTAETGKERMAPGREGEKGTHVVEGEEDDEQERGAGGAA